MSERERRILSLPGGAQRPQPRGRDGAPPAPRHVAMAGRPGIVAVADPDTGGPALAAAGRSAPPDPRRGLDPDHVVPDAGVDGDLEAPGMDPAHHGAPGAVPGAADEASEPIDLEARPAPVVVVDEELGRAITASAFRSAAVADFADRLAMLARQREDRPLLHRESREARILAQADAIFATGASSLEALLGWWRGSPPEAIWSVWALAFVFASTDRPSSLALLEAALESLPDDDGAPRLAAEALAVAAHPHLSTMVVDLLAAPEAAARACGVELASHRGLLAAEALEARLADPSPAVVAAALRGLTRLPELHADSAAAHGALDAPDAEVAWEAARAVTLWGSRDAQLRARDEPAFASRLGPRSVELFVMAGAAADAEPLGTLVRRCSPSAELLSAVARFGHPGSWAYLSHFLTLPSLADAAADALTTLFGDLVAAPQRSEPGAWKRAIEERRLDGRTRYRGGQPWTPAVVAAEVARGHLTRRGVEARLDELRARTGVHAPCDLTAWWSELGPAIAAVPAAYAGARELRRW